MGVTKMSFIDQLTKIGNEWKKNDMHRIYFNNFEEMYGMEITRYKTGNLQTVLLDGEKISNSKAQKIISSLSDAKLWYDVSTGEFQSQNLSEELFEKFVGIIKSQIVEEVAEQNEEPLETTPEENTVVDTVYEYQQSNGGWSEIGDRMDMFVNLALKNEQSMAPRQNRQPMTTREEIISAMDSGKTITIGSDWYDKIRAKPAPIKSVPVEMIKCSCGHTVPRSSVMSTSRGTSCPDCYDKMSD